MNESVLHEASPSLDTKSPEWCEKIKYRAVKSECAKNAYYSWLEALEQGQVVKSDVELQEEQKKCFGFAKLIYAREVQGANFRREEMEFRAKCLDRVSSSIAARNSKLNTGLSH